MLDSIDRAARRLSIGGSDAKIIMGDDYKALLQLWKEKRGETSPQDYSRNLVVQLGNATEDLTAQWFEYEHPELTLAHRQTSMTHDKYRWMSCTLDGIVAPDGDVFEGKFMLPWSFDLEAAVQKHWWQLQHNMFVAKAKKAWLSIVTGGGQYHCKEVMASAVDQAVLRETEQKFWFAVEEGLEPVLAGAEAPTIAKPATKIVNMRKSNAWAQYAAIYLNTHDAHSEHEDAKKNLKALVPEDAKEAKGHRVRAKKSKSGSITFEPYEEEEEVDA